MNIIPRGYKKYLYISLFLLGAYCICWFYLALKFEQQLNNIDYSDKNLKISFDKVKVSGFPHKFRLDIENPVFTFSKIFNSSLTFSGNIIQAETNILFNKIKLNFPTKGKLIGSVFNHNLNLSIVSKGKDYIELNDASYCNLFRIIHLSRKNISPSLSDFSITNLQYKNDKLNYFDNISNKEILTTSTALSYSSKYISDSLSVIDFKSTKKIQFLDSSYLNENLKNFGLKIDISAELEPHNNVSLIKSFSSKLIELDVEDSKITLTGKANDKRIGKITFGLNLKISNFNDLIERVKSNNFFSSEKLEIIDDLIKTITGKTDNNSIDIVIQRGDNDNFTRIGNVDAASLTNHLQQFIKSK